MIVTNPYLLEEERTVFLLRGDPALGRMLQSATKGMHLRQVAFLTSEEVLRETPSTKAGCIVVGFPSEERAGVKYLEELSRGGSFLPVIVVMSGDDLRFAVQAMRAGAWNVLSRSCSVAELAAAIGEAIDRDIENRRRLAERLRLQRRLAKLTPGEQDVLRMIVDGKSNKSIGDALRISVRAVEVRRSKLMAKMKAESLAELIRMALAAMPEPAGI